MKKLFTLFLVCVLAFSISCKPGQGPTAPDGGNSGGGGNTGSGGGNTGGGYVLPKGSLSQEEQNKPMDPAQNYTVLFKAGEGATGWRIPALAVTKKGTIIAAADRRANDYPDLGKGNVIDVYVRTSKDLGKTWTERKLVGPGATKTADSYGDAFLINNHDGSILLGVITEPGIQKKNISETGITIIYRSDDEGQSWREYCRLDQESVVFKKGGIKPSTGFGASGQGLTLRYGQNAGKVMFAFFGWGQNSAGSSPLSVSSIISSDGGKNWVNTGYINGNNADGNFDETKAIELSDGTILLNHRRSVGAGQRSWSKSTDGGKSWTWEGVDPELKDPGNNADMFRYEYNGRRIKTDKYILYVHSEQNANGQWYYNRFNHHVKLSVNELNNGNVKTSGKFKYDRALIPNGMDTYSGYPTITVLPDGTMATLTEELPKSESKAQDHYNVVFRRFNLNWLTSGAESVDYSKDFLFSKPIDQE